MVLMVNSITFSQITPVGHLSIFSEDGDKFTLILNGEVINDEPQTNLRVEDLNQPYYNAKVRFADNTLEDITKNNLMIADADGVFVDVTYKIRRDKNKKGKMKMNYFSAIPVTPDFIPASNVHVIHYGSPRPVGGVQVQQQVGGVSQTTTTTTTQTGGVNVGVGVNIGGINMGVSINDPLAGEVVTQTTTTTHTSHDGHNHGGIINQTPRGCNGISCMSPGNFNAALATIKKQSFEDTMLKTAKQVISVNCLNVDQIIQIANLFNFEDNKLDFAKYAYDFCTEKRNYFKLNGIFSFSSNVDELSDYVQSRQ